MAPAEPGDEPQWPPRSPHEALLGTPKGREKYRRMLEQTSPSPSPRRPRATHQSPRADASDDDEDEDEETLQLKLEAIQARLKLKKLQNAKTAAAATTKNQGEAENSRRTPLEDGLMRSPSAASNTRGQRVVPGRGAIEVPASPVRKIQAQQVPTSPSRVLLGIDKGLKAKDISLKRAPNFKRAQPLGAPVAQQGAGFRQPGAAVSGTGPADAPRPMSFNERLASVRNEEISRAERQKRIQQVRMNQFGIGQDEMEQYKTNAVEIPNEPLAAPAFTREEIMGQQKPVAGLRRSNTLPGLNAADEEKVAAPAKNPGKGKAEASDSFESYSSFHLSRRILPHLVLTRHISNAKTFSIKDLLKVVKAPDFSLPDIEQDIVVFAILARKSDPRSHKPVPGKQGAPVEDRGKFMVMTLVDLNFEIELFLFNSGFSRFWKLSEGTVIAILNPNIMPPPPGRQDTGRFSLVINSDADTILEIGTARDLGFCASVKKDGTVCGAWVNQKKTQFCEFHSNEALRKRRATRIEVNTNSFGGFSEKHWRPKSTEMFPVVKDKNPNKHYDRFTQSNYFTTRSMSAADLIDGKDVDPLGRQEKADFVKRNIEAKEKERDIMKKLGNIGTAAGREYMQRAGSRALNDPNVSEPAGQSLGSVDASASDMAPRATAESLGLLGKDRTIHLSPIKRKRPDNSRTSSAASLDNSNKSGFGWGGNLKDKLAKMKEGEKLHKEEAPPVRKKTRFVTDKGIREAGRDSLGLDLSGRQVSFENDDDDELVFV
jgi:minichromosome maintenance protein 10